MKTTKNLFSESDCLLVLGEGNFSFTTCLSKTFKCKIIATDVSTNSAGDSFTQHNCEQLVGRGHQVFFGIDATKLEDYPQLEANQNINYIIFNFPHVLSKKMKIGLNRDLLKQFFKSASKMIGEKKGIKILVSLCGGQSGVNAVEAPDKRRVWFDSWQLPEMAANGHFVITGFENFSFSYQLFGYRLRNASFNASDAKTFTLEKRQTIDVSSDKLSRILMNNQKNLFVKHLIIGLLSAVCDLTDQLSVISFTRIDYKTNTFPFVKHWIEVRIEALESDVLLSLSRFLGHVIAVEDGMVSSNGVVVGHVSGDVVRLCVEQLARLKFNVNDSRILWSEYMKFDEEDNQYKTGSLFYRQHIHDISFWVNSDFNYKQLLETNLDVFGTLLKSIALIDSYVSNGKTSKCYRFAYESVDRGFSRDKCNRMQNRFRDLLTQRYGLALR